MDKARMEIYGAWHSAVFARTKKMPALDKVMPTVHNEKKQMTREQQIAMFRGFFGAHKMKAQAQDKARGKANGG